MLYNIKFPGISTRLPEEPNKKDNDRYRYDPKNNPTIEYLYAGGDILSRNVFKDRKYRGNYRNMKVKDTAYYHQDPLGSTVMITDKKGHVEGNFSYDAFGTLYDDSRFSWGNDNLNERGKHSVPLNLYNGKRLDPAVGLYDYGFRDYSPQQMRFTTVDPIKSGSNWYAYVSNDPVNFVDMYGLFTNKQVGTVVMIVGGVGIFAGGNVPAALLMASGAILFTTPESDTASDLEIIGQSYANFSTPLSMTLVEELVKEDTTTSVVEENKNSLEIKNK